MGRRRRLLVPEARVAMDQLKWLVASERSTHTGQSTESQPGPARSDSPVGPSAVSALQFLDSVPVKGREAPSQPIRTTRERQNGASNHKDGGEMTTREAGKLGGELGGNMVQRLIRIAEQQLTEQSGHDTFQ